MKLSLRYNLILFPLALLFFPLLLAARPIDFKEVSLLVRSHESESSIRDEVAQRKLMHALTAPQEAALRSQGASEALLRSLRDGNLVASKEEAEAFAAMDRRNAEARIEAASGPKVRIFNVAFGHPINLSEFGGADYEIALYSYRTGGEDHVQAGMIDNIRTGTRVSRVIPMDGTSEGEAFASTFFPVNEVRNWRFTPYSARNDLSDNRFTYGDTISASSQAFARPLAIDWDSPMHIPGQPYNFYHVYGAGGVTLYYIGNASSESARVAVVSRSDW